MNIYKLSFLLLLPFPFGTYLASEFPKSTVGEQIQATGKPGVESVLFKSADGGQTWQDMTKELPESLQHDGFIVNYRGLRWRICCYHFQYKVGHQESANIL